MVSYFAGFFIKISKTLQFSNAHYLRKPFKIKIFCFFQGRLSNIQNGKILPLRVGEYFAYLNIDDTTIVPFLISETISKTITFGYQYEKQYSLFSTSYKIENYSEKYCKVSFLKIKCPKLKIEKNKITELKLKIDSSSRFDGKTTGMVWILTGLFAIDVSVRGISSIPPGIILGSIFFKKNVAFDINTIDASK